MGVDECENASYPGCIPALHPVFLPQTLNLPELGQEKAVTKNE